MLVTSMVISLSPSAHAESDRLEQARAAGETADEDSGSVVLDDSGGVVFEALTTAARPSGKSCRDDFEGRLKLNWQLLRPDPTHFSLAKNPGSLTISTQNGTIHLKRDLPKAKNILLLDNPYPEGPAFVVTTCLDGFRPREPFQQAGLIIYNDDDNYLKWVLEQTTSGGVPSRVAWNLLREDNGSPQRAKLAIEHDMTEKIWIRLTQRQNQYEYATSTDGKDWAVHGELPWGDGCPKRIGLLAKNGGTRAAASIDARFDFFEIQPLPPMGAESPNVKPELQNEKADVHRNGEGIQGIWTIVGQRQNGSIVDFEDGLQVVIGQEAITVKSGKKVRERCDYRLRSNRSPKEIDWLGNSELAGRGIYRLKGDTLEICMAHRGEKTHPNKFATVPGDGYCLLTLQRIVGEIAQ